MKNLKKEELDKIYESVVELTTYEDSEGIVAAVYVGNEEYFKETLQVVSAEKFILVIDNINKATMKASEYMTEKLVKSIFKLVKRMSNEKKEAFVRTHYDNKFKISA